MNFPKTIEEVLLHWEPDQITEPCRAIIAEMSHQLGHLAMYAEYSLVLRDEFDEYQQSRIEFFSSLNALQSIAAQFNLPLPIMDILAKLDLTVHQIRQVNTLEDKREIYYEFQDYYHQTVSQTRSRISQAGILLEKELEIIYSLA